MAAASIKHSHRRELKRARRDNLLSRIERAAAAAAITAPPRSL